MPTRAELIAEAKKRGHKGVSTKKKAELEALLSKPPPKPPRGVPRGMEKSKKAGFIRKEIAMGKLKKEGGRIVKAGGGTKPTPKPKAGGGTKPAPKPKAKEAPQPKAKINIDKLFKFNTVKSGLALAETILKPTKQQVKNVKVEKFGNLREYIFSEDKKMYLSVVHIRVVVNEMRDGLKKYVATGDLRDYDNYIRNEVYVVSAMAGFGFNLDVGKAIAEIHRAYPESRGATTRYTGGDYNLNAPQVKSGLHRIGIRTGGFMYILEAKPFGYPTLIKKHNDKDNTFFNTQRKITTVNLWRDMRKPFTDDYDL